MSSRKIGKRTALKRHNYRPGSMTAIRKSKLQGQVKSLRSTKMAAARMLANAATAGFLGIEKKFLDCTRTETAIAANTDLTGGEYDPSATSGPGGGSGGCVDCISCPVQGDGEQQRDGKKIVIDSVILKGAVFLDASAAATAAFDPVKVFVAVVLDTQTNGAQMSSEGCFKSLGAAAELNACPLKNLLSGKRFRILKSQIYDLTPIGVATNNANLGFNGTRRDFDWYIPFKGGLPVELNSGTTANVSNVIDNSIHVIAFATLGGSKITYNSRIRFQG